MNATHLPFAVETMGGLSTAAQQLVHEIHNSTGTHCTWRDAKLIGTHQIDSVAIAVQRYTGNAGEHRNGAGGGAGAGSGVRAGEVTECCCVRMSLVLYPRCLLRLVVNTLSLT